MTLEIKSIQTKKIYKNIVEQIVGLICEGSLKAGDKLPPERNLAEMFNVSRASLREALSVMEILGIVEIRPGEGSFVSDINVEPFISLIFPLLLKEENIEKDLLDLRKILEISNIRLVVKQMEGDEPILLALEKVIVQMRKTKVGTDPEVLSRQDVEFHSLILSLGKNLIMSKVLNYVNYIIKRSIRVNQQKFFSNEEIVNNLLIQHEGIYNAILVKDEELAADKMELHLSYVEDKLLNMV